MTKNNNPPPKLPPQEDLETHIADLVGENMEDLIWKDEHNLKRLSEGEK